MRGLVILDPEAPDGRRRVRYGPVVNGQTIASPAMKKLVEGIVKDGIALAEREVKESAWVERQLAAAPPLTVSQTRMLRRVKTDLTRAAQQVSVPS
jgi:hypothetical protein